MQLRTAALLLALLALPSFLLACVTGRRSSGGDDDDAGDDDAGDDDAGDDDAGDDDAGDDDAGDDDAGDDDAGDDDVTVSCEPDEFEDNDTQDAPAALTPGDYPGLTACAQDDDFYSFQVQDDEVVNVLVAFDHAVGDIDIALLTPGGVVLRNGNSITDDEVLVDVPVPSTDDYILRVRPIGGANEYDLEVDVGPAPPPDQCPSDPFEPNNGDGAGAALTAGSHGSLHVCEDDEDWYTLTLAADTTLTVDATFTDAEGDIELHLRDPGGQLRAVADSSSDNETLGPYTTTTSGDFQLRVYLNGDDGSVLGNSYSLDVDIDAPSTCPTDSLEDNDSASSPATLTEGLHNGLYVCNSDEDWYVIPLLAGADLTIDATFTHAEGDIDLELTRVLNGNLAAQAGSPDDNEHLELIGAPATDDYLLQIILYNDLGSVVGNGYSLNVVID
jgi:hypothetical protein